MIELWNILTTAIAETVAKTVRLNTLKTESKVKGVKNFTGLFIADHSDRGV
jgi:hypothetical protein